MRTAGRKRKRSYSRGELDDKDDHSSSQSSLQTRINELIEKHKIQHQQPGRSTSEILTNGFIRYIWPEIRDDYRRMTHYLEEELKAALKDWHIDAEVSSRVKEDASVTKTLERRQKGLFKQGGSGFNSYEDIFDEMHDLSGLRIVLMDRENRDKAQTLIEELFKKQKSPTHFDPNREVGQFWRRPWFGAYETHNHRVQLTSDNEAALGDSHRYFGVTFEIQLTTFSNNLYNKLAHDLLYKADPGLVTSQEEMVIDVSHGLARCFELCMKILRPKMHRDTDNKTPVAAESIHEYTQKEAQLAQLAVDDFERDLHNHSESDRIAQQLRKLLSKKEDAKDQACLKDLLGSDPRVDKTRIEDTKGGLLPSSHNWILGDHDFQDWRENGQNHPFWITGAPGKGKTMMICGIINGLSEESNTNVSYFFCQGTDNRINTGTAVLRGLLFLLCKQQHSLISHIRDKYDDAGGKLFEDTNAWFALSGIFDDILGNSSLRRTYLIVDALDECHADSRHLLVKFIFRMSNSYPNIRWIVASREMLEFNTHLQKATHLSLESRGELVYSTVHAYIDVKVTKLRETDLGHSTVEKIKRELKRKSEGTFLWVAIVCQQLELAQAHNVLRILQNMPKGLGQLYGKLVDDINALDWDDPKYCKSVLRAVAVAFRPLTLMELEALADIPQNVTAEAIAKMCMSFITIRDDTVFFIHQSAKDYLANEWQTVFQIPIRDTHESMFLRSIHAMKQILHQDMYSLAHPGISIENIQRPSPDPLVSIRYSCVYWVTHFREGQPCSAEDAVGDFLRHHFLYWFEALSLIRSASVGVYALRDLVTLSNKGHRLENLFHLTSDMYRFAQSNAALIGKAPLQAYSSALIFSPTDSSTRKLFTPNIPDWIVQKPRVEQHWNSCLITLGADVEHTARICSVAFSSNGCHVVSVHSDGIISIWDAESGTTTLSLRAHSDRVHSAMFDEESKIVTSWSYDGIIETWDANTGACISTCEGAEEQIHRESSSKSELWHYWTSSPKLRVVYNNEIGTEVSTFMGHDAETETGWLELSRDGRLIASALDDTTIRVWDAVTGDVFSTLVGHDGDIISVCFSPDASRIASASTEGHIKIWDVKGSAGLSTPPGFSATKEIFSVALSHDGSRIVSGSWGTIIIWDARTGESIRTVKCDYWEVDSVTFSPDDRYIAVTRLQCNSASIFDPENGVEISAYGPAHGGPLALSLDGYYIATCCENTTTITDSKVVVTLEGHTDTVTSVAFSPQVCQVVASSSLDRTIRIWNVVSGAEISSLNVGIEPDLLRFDPTGACLHMALYEYRDFTCSSNWTPSQCGLSLPQVRQEAYGLSEDNSWITWHGQNVLWLPPAFRFYSKDRNIRGTSCDVLQQMISIGCYSGRVWWLRFSYERNPFANGSRYALD